MYWARTDSQNTRQSMQMPCERRAYLNDRTGGRQRFALPDQYRAPRADSSVPTGVDARVKVVGVVVWRCAVVSDAQPSQCTNRCLMWVDFVAKVFWSSSKRGRPENDSWQAWI